VKIEKRKNPLLWLGVAASAAFSILGVIWFRINSPSNSNQSILSEGALPVLVCPSAKAEVRKGGLGSAQVRPGDNNPLGGQRVSVVTSPEECLTPPGGRKPPGGRVGGGGLSPSDDNVPFGSLPPAAQPERSRQNSVADPPIRSRQNSIAAPSKLYSIRIDNVLPALSILPRTLISFKVKPAHALRVLELRPRTHDHWLGSALPCRPCHPSLLRTVVFKVILI
jgi:hypothetical protein